MQTIGVIVGLCLIVIATCGALHLVWPQRPAERRHPRWTVAAIQRRVEAERTGRVVTDRGMVRRHR
ncbi:hypothetical protein [Amycolatopsis cihanbeyliensis]|uniref:Uncharacterized protein n=1 Tax=Amycolatopsis cihanbeyliensis TaxID=1128664 RepID=A0A542DG08_AMYCI|nr:hypothetical protein [Amycolatopsis cihanbeyliensis]TQJ01971.1 hypothetical protein FB471_1688 [Amycolatopsis cihanbeyliensis]